LLVFLVRHADDFPQPATRDMMEGTGITSTSVVNYTLDIFEKRGLLQVVRDRRGERVPRGTRVKPDLIPVLRRQLQI
jgi:hypothetical protein